MEAARLQLAGQLHGVPCAFHIGHPLAVGFGGQVINGSEVEKMLDLSLQLFQLRRRHTQFALAKITGYRHDSLAVPPHALANFGQLLLRPLAYQGVNRALALQQIGHQVAPDETGGSGHEIRHDLFPSGSAN